MGYENNPTNNNAMIDAAAVEIGVDDAGGLPLLPIVHSLSPRWVFWLWDGDRDKQWSACLRQQCIIASVEDFIALKNIIVPPSRLPRDVDHILNYMFFKEGIQPMWEDPNNCRGGSIDVLIARAHQYTRLDRLWFELLIAAMGAQFGAFNGQICGVVLRFRARGYAISLWIRNASDSTAYAPILDTLESKLGIGTDRCVQICINKHPAVQQQQNGGGKQQL